MSKNNILVRSFDLFDRATQLAEENHRLRRQLEQALFDAQKARGERGRAEQEIEALKTTLVHGQAAQSRSRAEFDAAHAEAKRWEERAVTAERSLDAWEATAKQLETQLHKATDQRDAEKKRADDNADWANKAEAEIRRLQAALQDVAESISDPCRSIVDGSLPSGDVSALGTRVCAALAGGPYQGKPEPEAPVEFYTEQNADHDLHA